MRMIASFVLFMGLAIAAPAPQRPSPPAEGRLAPQTSNMITSISGMLNAKGELDAGLRPLVRNQVIDTTPCGKVIFIFARASMEPNNMVSELQILNLLERLCLIELQQDQDFPASTNCVFHLSGQTCPCPNFEFAVITASSIFQNL
jgi:hypothetical protein